MAAHETPAAVITIRLAAEADAPVLAQIAAAAYQQYVPLIGREPAPMTAGCAGAVQGGQAWVAAGAGGGGGGVQGFIVLIPQPGFLLLENVAVLPAAQGRGVGARLLAFAEERALALQASPRSRRKPRNSVMAWSRSEPRSSTTDMAASAQ